MSDLHAEMGHFSRPVKRELMRLYRVCPICGGHSGCVDMQFDHIVPLSFFAEYPAAAKEIMPNGPHDKANGWRICAGPNSCHAKKSVEEYRNAWNGAQFLTVVNKWYAKAYRKARGGERGGEHMRIFWQGKARKFTLSARKENQARKADATAKRAAHIRLSEQV